MSRKYPKCSHKSCATCEGQNSEQVRGTVPAWVPWVEDALVLGGLVLGLYAFVAACMAAMP